MNVYVDICVCIYIYIPIYIYIYIYIYVQMHIELYKSTTDCKSNTSRAHRREGTHVIVERRVELADQAPHHVELREPPSVRFFLGSVSFLGFFFLGFRV